MGNKNHQLSKNEKGIAILLVISAVLVLTIVIVEMTFNTQIFNALTRNRLESLQAIELAKTGVSMAILELNVHQQLAGTIKGTDAISKALRTQFDQILKFGFVYPPPISEDLRESTKDEIRDLKEKSSLKGSVKSSIQDLGGRINLNNFAVSKELSAATLHMLNEVLKQEVNKNEETKQKYRDLNIPEIVNNIADYIDPNRERVRGGEENLWYSQQTPPRFSKNMPLDDISELRLIEGVDEDVYNLLKDKVTIYGKAININTATKEILLALIPSMDEKELTELLRIRAEQPFSSQEDFEKYAKSTLRQNEDFNTNPKIPLTGKSNVFGITSVAQVGRVTRVAEVIVEQTKETKILSWEII